MKPNPKLIPRFNLDYDSNDLLSGLKAVFHPRDVDLSVLHKIFGNRLFYFTNSGRTALYVILRALHLPEGSKIGVPLYSCPSVFDAILQAGHYPYFIDIDLENYTLDPVDLKRKISKLDAIVVIHTFGRPADMNEIVKIAGNIPLIEDCAHSLLSEYKGKITGTIGDFSFFSFGLGKCISAGGGGMIILNDEKFKENIEKEIYLLPTQGAFNETRNLVLSYTRSVLYHRPWFGSIAFPIGKLLDNKIDLMGKKKFIQMKITGATLDAMFRKLVCYHERIKTQRKNSKILLNELEESPLKLPYEKESTYSNYYLFPVLFEIKEKRDAAQRCLSENGVDSAALFSATPLKAAKYYGYNNGCPNTEKLADGILTIPNHYVLTKDEVMAIAQKVKEVIYKL